MNLPKIVSKSPVKINVKKDTRYAWCSCGLSAKDPYCDGSHKGTGFKPMIVKEEADKTIFLCSCKNTSNSPYCDGTHNNL